MVFTRWDVQQKFIDEMNRHGLTVKNVLIWDKVWHGMGDLKRSFASRYESVLFHSENEFRFQGKRPQDILRVARVPARKMVHPNEKPVALLEMLVFQCSEKDSMVLDLFMGSGSTGVACVNTNRNFIGIEVDRRYFEVAKQRIRDAQEQKKLEALKDV